MYLFLVVKFRNNFSNKNYSQLLHKETSCCFIPVSFLKLYVPMEEKDFFSYYIFQNYFQVELVRERYTTRDLCMKLSILEPAIQLGHKAG